MAFAQLLPIVLLQVEPEWTVGTVLQAFRIQEVH